MTNVTSSPAILFRGIWMVIYAMTWTIMTECQAFAGVYFVITVISFKLGFALFCKIKIRVFTALMSVKKIFTFLILRVCEQDLYISFSAFLILRNVIEFIKLQILMIAFLTLFFSRIDGNTSAYPMNYEVKIHFIICFCLNFMNVMKPIKKARRCAICRN